MFSIVKLLKFITEKTWLRVLLSLIMLPLLSALYIHDVFRLFLFSWGTPALNMTQWSRDIEFEYVNAMNFCVENKDEYDEEEEEGTYERDMIAF